MNELLSRIFTPRHLAALSLGSALVCAEGSYAQGVKRDYRTDRLIVMPKRGADSPGLQKLHSQGGRRVLNAFKSMGDLQVIQLARGEKMAEVALHYMSSGLVEFVEPDYKLHASAVPNDPEFTGGTQWALRNASNPGHDISAVAAWDTITSASNVVVAIVDSGIRLTHNDLVANLWTNPKEIADNETDDDRNGIVDDIHGINAIDSTGDVNDDAGHGTHVAGIIGAVGNNNTGISGVAWKVQLMACKFLDQNGDGDTSDAIRCVDYARRNGAHIINASWGGPDFSAALNTAIANARAAGIIFVTAAGNSLTGGDDIDQIPIYPACYTLDNIVVVAGTGRSDTVDSSYSNFGAVNVDLCAPGSGIYSTWNSWDGAYTYLSGTSMAAPHVSGAFALLKARFPTSSTTELINRLYSTVDVLPGLAGKCKTSGRLNLARALGSDPTANFSASILSGEPPLAVTFTNTTVGQLRSITWNFGDGTEIVTNANPTHVFARAGTFNVRLTVIGTNDRTNFVEQKITAASNYEAVPETYAWVDPAEMAVLALGDNGVSPATVLPFAFNFYGVTYNSIYIGANGVLGFNSAGLASTSNSSLPSGSSPNAIICPYWDNLNPGAGGIIYYGETGQAPNRRFVVSWVDVPRNSTAVKITFQAILEEVGGQIVFQYLDVAPESTRGGAKGATVGLEDQAGSSGALYIYNGNPRTLANASALRFKPHSYNYLLSDRSKLVLRAAAGTGSAQTPLTLSNPGNEALSWSLASLDSWLRLSAVAGTLEPGANTNINLNLTSEAAAFEIGEYSSVLTLSNQSGGGGTIDIPVSLAVEPRRALLALAASGQTQFVGGLGGPFLPGVVTMELRNDGNVAVDWKQSADVNWLVVNPGTGRIEPGQSTFVEVSVGEGAGGFGSGSTNAVLSFQNLTESQVLTQEVRLEVRSRIEQAAATIANGIFSGSLEVPAGSSYQVEFSEDLQSWTPIDGVKEIKNGLVLFEDSTISGTQRFYRVRVD